MNVSSAWLLTTVEAAELQCRYLHVVLESTIEKLLNAHTPYTSVSATKLTEYFEERAIAAGLHCLSQSKPW